MSISEDTKELDSYINEQVDIDSVASFKGNEHIVKLQLKFDIKKIRESLDEIKANAEFKTAASGFHALAMTEFLKKTASIATPGIEILSPGFISPFIPTLVHYL